MQRDSQANRGERCRYWPMVLTSIMLDIPPFNALSFISFEGTSLSGKSPRMQKYLAALSMIGSLLLAGCDEQPAEQSPSEICSEILDELDATGKLTDAQMELMVREHSDSLWDPLRRLTSITDSQAESLSELPYELWLDNLPSITDKQAESLSKVELLFLNGLITITDPQANSLGQVHALELKGLTTMTKAHAASLSQVGYLKIPEDLQPQIDKYRNE